MRKYIEICVFYEIFNFEDIIKFKEKLALNEILFKIYKYLCFSYILCFFYKFIVFIHSVICSLIDKTPLSLPSFSSFTCLMTLSL